MMAEKEQVLVVKAASIFAHHHWLGMEEEKMAELYALVLQEAFYVDRDQAEGNPSYQQIIPYLLFRVGERYFVTERLPKSGEPRLHGEIAMGLGGHINPCDQEGADDLIMAAAKREFKEEVNYRGNLKQFRLLAILIDESSPVNQDHLGFVYLLEGDSEDIQIAEVDKLRGFFVTLAEMAAYQSRFEVWSRHVFKFIQHHAVTTA